MNSSRFLLSLVAIACVETSVVSAAAIDMNDPRRALGREGDVRVDAQLSGETVSPGTPIVLTYQIQNFSPSSVAIASKVSDASYDPETRTITFVVGSEVPPDGNMPQMIVIASGEKRVLQTAATPMLQPAQAAAARLSSAPRYVQVKVAILRDIRPFETLIGRQDGRSRPRLSDELFEKWFECTDTIFLNSIPVQFEPRRKSGAEVDASRAGF